MSWRYCYSSSGFSLSQFFLFLHIIPDGLDDGEIRSLCEVYWLLSDYFCIQKSHWIITINGKRNVWKCKLIFPTDTLQQRKNTNGLRLLHSNVYSVHIHIQRERVRKSFSLLDSTGI